MKKSLSSIKIYEKQNLNLEILLTSLLESYPTPFFTVDKEYKYSSFNTAHANVMKEIYDVEIELDHAINEYQTNKEDWELAKQNIDKALVGETITEETMSGHIEKKRTWFEVTYNPIFDENNEIAGVLILTKDMSEKKEAEILKQRSENKFQLLFENAPMGYQSLDFDGCFIEVNQQWINTLGYAREEVIGKWFGDFLNEEYKEGFRKRFPKFKVQGYIHSEFEMVHKNGSILFIAFDGKIGYDLNGEFKQSHCILQDITEKRKADEKLRESEEKFRSVFEYSVIGKSITTIDGELSVNKSFCDILGYREDEFKNINWRDITYKDDFDNNEKIVQSILSGEKNSERWIKRYIHKDGHIVWVELSTVLQRDDKGEPLYFITAVNDITKKRQAEKALIESERRFRELLSSVKMVSVLLDLNGNITFCNDFLLEKTHWKSQEIIGGNWFDIFIPKHQLNEVKNEFHNATIVGKININYENTILSKENEEILISWTNTLLFDSNGKVNGLASLGIDITEHRKRELSIRKSKDRLNRAEFASLSGNWELLVDSGIIKASKGANNVYGLNRGEFSYENIKVIPLPEYRTNMDNALKNLIENDTPYNIEFKIKKADTGEMRDIMSIAHFDRQQRIVFGIIRDITEQKLAEKSLRQSEELYRNLVFQIPDGVYKSSPGGKFIDVNPAMVKMLGYDSKEEFLQIDIKTQLYFNISDREQRVLKGKSDVISVFELKKKDGTGIWVEDHGWYNKDLDGNIISNEGVLRDITERLDAENELRERMAELMRFQKLTVGRELNMIALKQEINELLIKSGAEAKYTIVE